MARKVAPLFGVPVEASPFGRTWVCDFAALSLAELGRGAPGPDRGEQSRLDAEPRRGEDVTRTWAWAGRTVWTPNRTPTPGALTNATLNRFGPDTKAAAVLTGANRLLRGPADAIGAVSRHLADAGCDPEIRLAVWAGLVLEAYRAQPALVVAAVRARLVQRSLSTRWGDQVDHAGVRSPSAPSEIDSRRSTPSMMAGSGPGRESHDCRPTSFDLVDATLPLLGLAEDTAAGSGPLTRDALDDLASAWCHRLLTIGRPGRGVVWLAEDGDGSRRAHAMVRVGAIVAPFVAAALGDPPRRASLPAPPPLPEASDLAGAPLPLRRAHLLAAHVASNYLRYRDELLLDWPQLRPLTRDLVGEAARLSAELLAPGDPVAAQLAAYAAYLDVWDRLRSPEADVHARPADDPAWSAAVSRLEASERTVVAAWRSGQLDPGAASYLLEIAAVALAEASEASTMAGSTGTRAVARARWSAILASRGLTPDVDLTRGLDSITDAHVFHLQHYAAALARAGGLGQLRRALALQERVAAVRAEVIRGEPATFAAKSAAVRGAHELAAQIAADLVEATPQRERAAKARAAAAAVRHAQAVLSDPSTRLLLRAEAHPATRRAASIVQRAFDLASGHGIGVGADDTALTRALLDALATRSGSTPTLRSDG